MTSTHYVTAIARFDAANAEDPHRTLVNGQEQPEALVYARRMSQWLARLSPNASEPLRLAARCQHIRRWTIPRSAYPMTRAGYHQWRTRLADFHAQTAGAILKEVGYDETTIARVQSLVRKQRLKDDPETQLLEDVICLVFLEYYFADFARKHDEHKVLAIVRRTWQKMSPMGQQTALSLELSSDARALIEKALGITSPPPSGQDEIEDPQ